MKIRKAFESTADLGHDWQKFRRCTFTFMIIYAVTSNVFVSEASWVCFISGRNDEDFQNDVVTVIHFSFCKFLVYRPAIVWSSLHHLRQVSIFISGILGTCKENKWSMNIKILKLLWKCLLFPPWLHFRWVIKMCLLFIYSICILICIFILRIKKICHTRSRERKRPSLYFFQHYMFSNSVWFFCRCQKYKMGFKSPSWHMKTA